MNGAADQTHAPAPDFHHDTPDPGHAPGHSHIHDHDGIGWEAFRSSRTLQAVLGFVGLAAVVTVVGVIALWPSDEGRAAAVAQGELVGLGSERFAATVTTVGDEPCSYSTSDNYQECRIVWFMVDEGPFAGEEHRFQEFNLRFDAIAPDVVVGDGVIAGYEPANDAWFYADRDRRPSLTLLAFLFAVVVVALSRGRGVAALAGMVITVVVLVAFVARSVLDGNDPLLVAVVAASAIAFVSLYLTHGFNATTTVALASSLLALGLTLALASIFFAVARFTGLATEEALLLPFIAGDIDLSSLLLGGAILGTLGALDDVTVTQVATVVELRRRSPDLPGRELIASGIRVGRDHIASTVNTLLLAYAGASMPLLLLFAASDQALDKVANSELISVEIVRTLCGSIGLVAAVPLTTILAALVVQPERDGRADSSPGTRADAQATAADASRQGGTVEPASAVDTTEAASPRANAGQPQTAAAQPPVAPQATWDDFGPKDDVDF